VVLRISPLVGVAADPKAWQCPAQPGVYKT